jgi:hypothetical protein
VFGWGTRSSGTPLLAGNSTQPAEKFIRSCTHKTFTAATRGDCCGNLSYESSKNLSYWVTIRMGMSGSAIFQKVKKTSRLGVLQENNVRIIVATQGSETLSIPRQAE